MLGVSEAGRHFYQFEPPKSKYITWHNDSLGTYLCIPPSFWKFRAARFISTRYISDLSAHVEETPIKAKCGIILFIISFVICWGFGSFYGIPIMLLGVGTMIRGGLGLLVLSITYTDTENQDRVRVCVYSAARHHRLENVIGKLRPYLGRVTTTDDLAS